MRQLKFWTANTRAGKNENTSSNKSLLLLLFSPDQAKVVPPVNNSVNSKASLVTNGNCKLENERKRRNQSPARRPIFSARWTQRASLAAAVVTGRNGDKLAAYEFTHLADGHCSAWTGLDWPGHWRCSSREKERRKWKVNERTQTEHWRHCACPKQAITEEKVERVGDMPSAEIERFQHASIIITINGT